MLRVDQFNSSILIVEIATGVFVGLLSAFALLFVSHKMLSSRIYWSNNIRSVWLGKSQRPSYSIKVRKKGAIDLIEAQIQCRLAIRDVLKNEGRLWNYYDIPTSFSQSLRWGNDIRLVHLKLHEAQVYDFKKYPYFVDHLIVGRPNVGLRLEDFFTSYNDVYINLFVVGHDRMTGVKKLYESPKFRFFQIRDGKWIHGDLTLEVNFQSEYA